MFYDVWGQVIIYCVFHFVPSVILDLGYLSLSVKSTSLKLLWWEQSSHLQRERERPRDSQASSNCCRSLLFQCQSPPGHRRYSALGPPSWVLPGFLTQKLRDRSLQMVNFVPISSPLLPLVTETSQPTELQWPWHFLGSFVWDHDTQCAVMGYEQDNSLLPQSRSCLP